jgi:aminoglycoside phosphotransferase (APT) family kinase protein
MKRPTPITAIAVSTAKPIAKPIRSRLASDGVSRRRDREYACEAMGDEATGQADGAVTVPEGIEPAALEGWFAEHVPGAGPPLRFERIAGGHSNLTYRVTDGAGRRWALRRPPLGRRLGSAHDMGREHKVVSALGPTEVPVAPVVGLCEEESVNGAPFYVMEFVEGPVLRGLAEAEAFPDEDDRRAIGERVADTLVAIHAVDPDAAGLGDLGRKEDYVARQLHRWQGQWEKSKTRELAAIDRVHERLSARIPEQGPATIVHGDYRLDNMILTPAGAVAAVVDWELCTLGDPLADVGLLMCYWPKPGEETRSLGQPANLAPGFPSREQLAARYAERSGRDLAQLDFYVALGYWKLAIILEGVYARYAAGGYGKVDEGFEAFAELVERLAETAEEAEARG